MGETVRSRETYWDRTVELASEIIDDSRVQLMLKFRFLDLALWRMPLEPVRRNTRYPMATDARRILFYPDDVLLRFQHNPVEAIRDYLHLVMHCIFRHPFIPVPGNKGVWGLACDIIVENAVMEMCGGRFESEEDEERKRMVSELAMHAGALTPAHLYNLLDRVDRAPEGSSYRGFTASSINTMRELFERDNHEAWPSLQNDSEEEVPGEVQELAQPGEDMDGEASDIDTVHLATTGDGQSSMMNKPHEAVGADEGDDADQDAAGGGHSDEASAQVDGDESGLQSDEGQGSSDAEERKDGGSDEREENEKAWEDIARRIETDLETFSKEWGKEASGLLQSLAVANRKTCDYAEFLRRFAVITEEMKISDEEYDYVFYTYGLQLYGNMPLIEPLEYKEEKRIRDFAICIDTSESVSGDLVRKFLEQSFEILKEAEGYASQVNVHIIQCDAKVQADTKITDLRDVDKLMEGFFIKGFGGTDFRPAFDYIEQLRDNGEFEDFRGLVYFTDGLGQYPEKTPDYDVAFVFMDTGEAHMPAVPAWAMKVVVNEEGINQYKSKLER